ncbi:MAG TPA: helix-turn-helix domain-containing protein [Candidatus Cybelea sp.]|nr:helix-turn-helix domain-containing protein [Candidatus Cybelea sp.]
MSILDAALRGGAVMLLLLLVLLLLRDGRRLPAARLGALFAFGVAAYTIASAPSFVLLPLAARVPVQVASSGNPVVFWVLAATLFDDEFKPSAVHGALWLGMIAIGFACMSGAVPGATMVMNGLSLLFGALAIWIALAGRAADLVEARRRLRLMFVVSAALYMVAISVSELVAHAELVSTPASIVNAFGLLALTFLFSAMQLAPSGAGPFISLGDLGVTSAAPRVAAIPASPVAVAPADSQESVLLDRLERLMTEDRVYREEGLSVAGLAARLGVPEYRLRRLINQRLGQRNFVAFVNGYRLADAEMALADPAQADVPVLTIALDAGFGSIGPFNRAFKANTGTTPTEYRRERLNRMAKAAAE